LSKRYVITLCLFASFADARLPREGGSDSRSRGRGSLSGVSIATNDNVGCFPKKLVDYIQEVRQEFGSVQIVSGHRSASDNARRGGAKKSQHVHCKAVDFKVPGVSKERVRGFLAANFSGRAGIGFYCNDRFHLDVGSPRQWGGCPPSSGEIRSARARSRGNQYAGGRGSRAAQAPAKIVRVPATSERSIQTAYADDEPIANR
jgi:hypothetical protein